MSIPHGQHKNNPLIPLVESGLSRIEDGIASTRHRVEMAAELPLARLASALTILRRTVGNLSDPTTCLKGDSHEQKEHPQIHR